MKYNVFHQYDRLNDEPMTLKQAECLKNREDWRHGYNIITSQICIQGIYPANEKGWKKFLDDMGWEAYGQHYDSFLYAMKYNERYCS